MTGTLEMILEWLDKHNIETAIALIGLSALINSIVLLQFINKYNRLVDVVVTKLTPAAHVP